MLIFAPLVIFAVAVFARRLQGGWLAPGPFMCGYWAAATAAPLLVAPEFGISSTATMFIAGSVLSYGVGSLLAAHRPPPSAQESEKRQTWKPNRRSIRVFVVCGSFAAPIAGIVIQASRGVSLTELFSPAIFAAARGATIDRYAGSLSIPTLAPTLLALTYASALLAPYAVQSLESRAKSALYVAAPIVGATAYAVLTTARSGMITTTCFILASWIVRNIWTHGTVPGIRPRALLAATLIFVTLVLTFFAIAFIRVGSVNAHYGHLLTQRMQVYAVGYLPAFSNWLDGPDPSLAPQTYGASSVSGVSAWITDAPVDAARQPTAIGDSPRDTTTVYSEWRTLVTDFGLVGVPPVMFAFGYGMSKAWNSLVSQGSKKAMLALTVGYAYVLHMTVFSILSFTNICLAFVVASFLLTFRSSTVADSLRVSNGEEAQAANGLTSAAAQNLEQQGED